MTATEPATRIARSRANARSVANAVNFLRTELLEREDPRSPEALLGLADHLSRHRLLRDEPAARALADDLWDDSQHPAMAATKAHINDRTDNRVMSVFSASYFPTLSFEFFEYEEIRSDDTLARCYPSPTIPANLLAHSAGFADPIVVALFPENHLDGGQTPDDAIFYFINKFITRQRFTRRLIEAAMDPNTFQRLRVASDDDLARAAASWVRLHEFHHRTGSMPIPEYLAAKSYRPLAGLEEMRTDVKSMLVCLNDTRLDSDLARVTYEFILGERLLRYAVEGIPLPNYDAISSQLLFNFLVDRGAVSLRGDRIELGDRLPEALQEMSDEIAAIEDRVHEIGVQAARENLIAFTKRFTHFDEKIGQFVHDPFFTELKARVPR